MASHVASAQLNGTQSLISNSCKIHRISSLAVAYAQLKSIPFHPSGIIGIIGSNQTNVV